MDPRYKPKLQPLSEDAQKARRPLPPDQLVEALNDPIHKEVGRSRAARVIKK